MNGKSAEDSLYLYITRHFFPLLHSRNGEKDVGWNKGLGGRGRGITYWSERERKRGEEGRDRETGGIK